MYSDIDFISTACSALFLNEILLHDEMHFLIKNITLNAQQMYGYFFLIFLIRCMDGIRRIWVNMPKMKRENFKCLNVAEKRRIKPGIE